MPETAGAITPTQTRSPLTTRDRCCIAQVLTWDIGSVVSPDEVIRIAIAHDILWVQLTRVRSIPIAVETFKSIRRAQLEHAARQQADADVAFVIAMESRLQVSAEQQPHIEIDRALYGVYRVWSGIELLGTFWASGDYWVAEPEHGERCRCKSALFAQRAILRSRSHGRADRLRHRTQKRKRPTVA